MTLGGYEIALICTIGFNLVFWVTIICWRLVFIPMCRKKHEIRREDVASEEAGQDNPGISTVYVDEGPPPYEEALKYPTPRQSLSTFNVDMSTGDIYPVNTSIHGYDWSNFETPTTYMSLSVEDLEQQESNS